MMIGALGSLAEYEREVHRADGIQDERHLAPMAPSSSTRKVDDSEHVATAKRMKADGRAGKDVAKYLGVSRATLYR